MDISFTRIVIQIAGLNTKQKTQLFHTAKTIINKGVKMGDQWTCPSCGWISRQGSNSNWYTWSEHCDAHLEKCKKEKEQKEAETNEH